VRVALSAWSLFEGSEARLTGAGIRALTTIHSDWAARIPTMAAATPLLSVLLRHAISWALAL